MKCANPNCHNEIPDEQDDYFVNEGGYVICEPCYIELTAPHMTPEKGESK